MKTLTAVVLSLLLFCPGEMKEWPEHTLCNMKDFEAYYKSCDPFQDFGFSIEPCGKYMPSPVIMKIAFLLRRDINELFFHSKIYLNGNHFLSYEAPMCEKTVPHFTFCGKKKGEFIYFEKPVKLGMSIFPKGVYTLSLELFNGDHYKIACTNVTFISR